MLNVPVLDFTAGLKHIQNLSSRTNTPSLELNQTVQRILSTVAEQGDVGLIEYGSKFDKIQLTTDQLEIPAHKIESAFNDLEGSIKNALTHAHQQVSDYHNLQKLEGFNSQQNGKKLSQIVRPLNSVGIYVPGGLASYPSTVMMNAIPAKIAGVTEIIMVTPPGNISEEVLAAAHLCGVTRVFQVGGAQAIAALAYGTESIPAVDKIVGPGNKFVATAKRLVYGIVDIDMIAGPSEILIIADPTAKLEWLAADLLAQAEHDPDACAVVGLYGCSTVDELKDILSKFLESLPRKEIARASMENQGAIITLKTKQQAVELINHMAPEHLQLMVKDPRSWLPEVLNSGAIFLGNNTCESLGDYVAGPSHVLPTGGTARFASPLSVYDFSKRISVLEYEKVNSQNNFDYVCAAMLARSEQLEGHARASLLRIANE